MSRLLALLSSPWMATIVGIILFFATSAVLVTTTLPPRKRLAQFTREPRLR